MLYEIDICYCDNGNILHTEKVEHVTFIVLLQGRTENSDTLPPMRSNC